MSFTKFVNGPTSSDGRCLFFFFLFSNEGTSTCFYAMKSCDNIVLIVEIINSYAGSVEIVYLTLWILLIVGMSPEIIWSKISEINLCCYWLFILHFLGASWDNSRVPFTHQHKCLFIKQIFVWADLDKNVSSVYFLFSVDAKLYITLVTLVFS